MRTQPWRDFARRLPRWLLMAPVALYRLTLSRIMPLCCRFEPSCSSYAMEALRRHGAWRGGWLTVRRVLRCQPWCEGGHDPVPPSANP
ncbi:MAG: membrane protein insertion efficiency factor YidD [Planctomycetes bacterium]|nr:membrane protein insertion efficiency factor YidD [Planctomycetota bacterium]